ncbi:cleavage and polyadenylation specificity factor subunit 4 isoform X2 [Pseudopipra pipra]|uniref:cleavage and polyadenylation specificity factor subunit 4 isoform X2 n=1 Tax=Pseudopipra pipra TaxID=415032 RepID=UPI003138A121
MQELIASVDHITFDLELAVEQQLGAQPLPFPGMDKSGAAVCEFFLKAACGKGGMCPFRHISGEKTVVCKHWLRGLCKKGDQCEFLHEYDMTKMPECYFYSKFGECSNKECPFLHIDPESKIKDCPWYDRGFCKHGPLCRHRHTRRVICVNYLVGFCPEGPACKFMQGHPKSLESCSLKTTTVGTEDPGPWSKSPATSVEKKVIMPTDAPKDIWPFSVDSEGAEGARLLLLLRKGFCLALCLELLIRLFFNAITERTGQRLAAAKQRFCNCLQFFLSFNLFKTNFDLCLFSLSPDER